MGNQGSVSASSKPVAYVPAEVLVDPASQSLDVTLKEGQALIALQSAFLFTKGGSYDLQPMGNVAMYTKTKTIEDPEPAHLWFGSAFSGSIHKLDLEPGQAYTLNQYAFIACTPNVTYATKKEGDTDFVVVTCAASPGATRGNVWIAFYGKLKEHELMQQDTLQVKSSAFVACLSPFEMGTSKEGNSIMVFKGLKLKKGGNKTPGSDLPKLPLPETDRSKEAPAASKTGIPLHVENLLSSKDLQTIVNANSAMITTEAGKDIPLHRVVYTQTKSLKDLANIIQQQVGGGSRGRTIERAYIRRTRRNKSSKK